MIMRKSARLRRRCRIIAKIGIWVWVLACLVMFVAPFWSGLSPVMIKGVSMEPTLYSWDIVLVSKCNPQTLQSGDIILYRGNGAHFVHRFLEDRGDAVRVGSDNPRIGGGWSELVPYIDVEGGVVLIVSRAIWIPMFASMLAGAAFLIVSTVIQIREDNSTG